MTSDGMTYNNISNGTIKIYTCTGIIYDCITSDGTFIEIFKVNTSMGVTIMTFQPVIFKIRTSMGVTIMMFQPVIFKICTSMGVTIMTFQPVIFKICTSMVVTIVTFIQ